MSNILRALVSALFFAGVGSVSVTAESPERLERARAIHLLAYGRPALDGESVKSADASTSALEQFDSHRKTIRADTTVREGVRANALWDVFGRPAAPADQNAADEALTTYAEIAAAHMARLQKDPAEYERTIGRAYQHSQRRDPYPGEIKYWTSRPAVSFIFLAACIDNWARRNQPGLMQTEGVASVSLNSEYISAQRVSPAVAEELFAALRDGVRTDRSVSVAAGRTILAPGADSIVSIGPVHFAAAGVR